jgi:hypothetical protein
MLLMDEGRKRVIGIMAAILAARRLAQGDGGKRVRNRYRTLTQQISARCGTWIPSLIPASETEWD